MLLGAGVPIGVMLGTWLPTSLKWGVQEELLSLNFLPDAQQNSKKLDLLKHLLASGEELERFVHSQTLTA